MSMLRTWLDEAWDRHDRDVEALAREWQDRAASVPNNHHGAETVHLARHMMLGHRADAQGLQRLQAALPAGEKPVKQRERSHWALATFDDRPFASLRLAARCGRG